MSSLAPPMPSRPPSSLPSDGTISIPSLIQASSDNLNNLHPPKVTWDLDSFDLPPEMITTWNLPPEYLKTDYGEWQAVNPPVLVSDSTESQLGYSQGELDAIHERMRNRKDRERSGSSTPGPLTPVKRVRFPSTGSVHNSPLLTRHTTLRRDRATTPSPARSAPRTPLKVPSFIITEIEDDIQDKPSQYDVKIVRGIANVGNEAAVQVRCKASDVETVSIPTADNHSTDPSHAFHTVDANPYSSVDNVDNIVRSPDADDTANVIVTHVSHDNFLSMVSDAVPAILVDTVNSAGHHSPPVKALTEIGSQPDLPGPDKDWKILPPPPPLVAHPHIGGTEDVVGNEGYLLPQTVGDDMNIELHDHTVAPNPSSPIHGFTTLSTAQLHAIQLGPKTRLPVGVPASEDSTSSSINLADIDPSHDMASPPLSPAPHNTPLKTYEVRTPRSLSPSPRFRPRSLELDLLSIKLPLVQRHVHISTAHPFLLRNQRQYLRAVPADFVPNNVLIELFIKPDDENDEVKPQTSPPDLPFDAFLQMQPEPGDGDGMEPPTPHRPRAATFPASPSDILLIGRDNLKGRAFRDVPTQLTKDDKTGLLEMAGQEEAARRVKLQEMMQLEARTPKTKDKSPSATIQHRLRSRISRESPSQSNVKVEAARDQAPSLKNPQEGLPQRAAAKAAENAFKFSFAAENRSGPSTKGRTTMKRCKTTHPSPDPLEANYDEPESESKRPIKKSRTSRQSVSREKLPRRYTDEENTIILDMVVNQGPKTCHFLRNSIVEALIANGHPERTNMAIKTQIRMLKKRNDLNAKPESAPADVVDEKEVDVNLDSDDDEVDADGETDTE